MNRRDLGEILHLLKIRAPTYHLDGDSSEYEAHCMAEESDGWHVYFFERGVRSSEDVYSSEADACVALLKRIAADPWTR